MKIASLVEELLSACDRRSTLYSSFDATIDKFKQARDPAVFSAALKKVGSDYSVLTSSINDICSALAKEDGELGEKV